MKKVTLYNMQFAKKEMRYNWVDAQVRVTPGYYTAVSYNERIEPGSPEYWGMALRAGLKHYQFQQGLQLGAHTYELDENRGNKPRKPRTTKQPAQTSEVEAL